MTASGQFALAVLLLTACSFTGADNSVVIREAWVREAPPGAPVLAAYFTLENPGPKADKLVAVVSPDFAKIDIHATGIRDGIARMLALDALPIPPHSKVALAPGATHLMLQQPRRALTAGMNVKLELRFDSGARLTVLAPVRRMESEAVHQH